LNGMEDRPFDKLRGSRTRTDGATRLRQGYAEARETALSAFAPFAQSYGGQATS